MDSSIASYASGAPDASTERQDLHGKIADLIARMRRACDFNPENVSYSHKALMEYGAGHLPQTLDTPQGALRRAYVGSMYPQGYSISYASDFLQEGVAMRILRLWIDSPDADPMWTVTREDASFERETIVRRDGGIPASSEGLAFLEALVA